MIANAGLVLLLGMLAGLPFAFHLIGKVELWPVPVLARRADPRNRTWLARGPRGQHPERHDVWPAAAVLPRLTLPARARRALAWCLIVTVWGNAVFYVVAACLTDGRALHLRREPVRRRRLVQRDRIPCGHGSGLGGDLRPGAARARGLRERGAGVVGLTQPRAGRSLPLSRTAPAHGHRDVLHCPRLAGSRSRHLDRRWARRALLRVSVSDPDDDRAPGRRPPCGSAHRSRSDGRARRCRRGASVRFATLVAPNKIHHLFLGEWRSGWPAIAALRGSGPRLAAAPTRTFDRPASATARSRAGRAGSIRWSSTAASRWTRWSSCTARRARPSSPTSSSASIRRQAAWLARRGHAPRRSGRAAGSTPREWRLSFWTAGAARAVAAAGPRLGSAPRDHRSRRVDTRSVDREVLAARARAGWAESGAAVRQAAFVVDFGAQVGPRPTDAGPRDLRPCAAARSDPPASGQHAGLAAVAPEPLLRPARTRSRSPTSPPRPASPYQARLGPTPPSTNRRHVSGGVAAGDYDGDGWLDLYVVHGDLGAALLFHNGRDGTFEEVAVSRGRRDSVAPAHRSRPSPITTATVGSTCSSSASMGRRRSFPQPRQRHLQ